MQKLVPRLIQDKKILFGVLNWGLGHASRSIPIIRELCELNEVVLASDGEAGELLKREFPKLQYLELPSYEIHYKYSSMHLNMLVQAPKIIINFKKEIAAIGKYIDTIQPDLIISDHRYGCRGEYVKSIFIGHQLNILNSAAATTLNKMLINKFDDCWIPDFADQRLSGRLSDTRSIASFKYIGPVSRMEKLDVKREFDLTAVLSGPEPRRTDLEKILIIQLIDSGLDCCLVRGTTSTYDGIISDKIKIVDLATTEELNKLMCSSRMIICRSGYSSVMDLEQLQIPSLIIPTVGQIEQEYLAKHLSKQKRYIVQEEESIDVLKAFEEAASIL